MSSLIQYGIPAPFRLSESLIAKLSERDYRHSYMVEGVKTWIARQVRALREQRGWSQEELGRETGKPQSAISRVEDPDYGKLTLQTLFDLARAYDLALLVQFTEWNDWLSRMDDASEEALQKDCFNEDSLKGEKITEGEEMVSSGTSISYRVISNLNPSISHSAQRGSTSTAIHSPEYSGYGVWAVGAE